MSTIPVGSILAQRFLIECFAGRGGMGTVYRATDLHRGTPVAIKLLQHFKTLQPAELKRFQRESQILSQIHDPGIVAYITHGQTLDDQPFLVTEWLQGEDLAQRLGRQGLTLTETLLLAQSVTRPLTAAHQRGIVHRDLKPSNIFLREGRIGQVALLDFGIAKTVTEASLTQTGDVIGTPKYMAPEQASGQREIGPSCDIYSLGCVLFECLTGRPPFEGEHFAALLAKALFQEAPRLREIRPELPEVLDELLAKMLTKQPTQRIADAKVLEELLDGLPTLCEMDPPVRSQEVHATPKSSMEQHLLTVIVSTRNTVEDDDIPTLGIAADTPSQDISAVRQALSPYTANIEVLTDGSTIATLIHSNATSAIEKALQAARGALLIKELWPQSRVALATGQGSLSAGLPLGDVLDRAWHLLRPQVLDSHPSLGTTSQVLLDEVTAGLLDARFSISRIDSACFALYGERASFDPARPLLGKPTPCLGRERELACLEGLLAECKDESVARPVLLIASAGVGKSRLRHEFVRRVQSRSEALEILIGRGDPMSAGSPYGIFGQAIRRLAEIADGEDQAVQRSKLERRTRQHISAPDAERVIEFIGELCGIPFSDEKSAPLRTARSDARIMSEQITAAVIDWLRAECTASPVMFILEDLHWGDSLSVRLLDSMLRELANVPLMILVLARPELKERFPNFWEHRKPTEIRLDGLTKKACERLIRQVLGEQASEIVIKRIIEQAAGNALYLEELIRAVAEGRGESLPPTVLAMLQARLSRLLPDARRVLRAASVYGQVFWRGGLFEPNVEEWLQILIEAEFIEKHRDSRFPEEVEYGFRHALMREAAYGMLSDAERKALHLQAAQDLSQAGERDPIVLAEHFQRAGQAASALPYYVRAAEQALESYDLDSARTRAECGIACNAQGSTLGALHCILCLTAYWQDVGAQAYQPGSEALHLLKPGSIKWCKAIGIMFLVTSTGPLEWQAKFGELVGAIGQVEPDADARGAYIEAISWLVSLFSVLGQAPTAQHFLSRLEEVSGIAAQTDPSVSRWLHWAHSHYIRSLQADPWLVLRVARRGAARKSPNRVEI